MSVFGLLALVALLYVLVGGLANPRTRPFIIGLGAFLGLGFLFLTFSRFNAVRVQDQQSMAQFQQEQAQSMAQFQRQQAREQQALMKAQVQQQQDQVRQQQAQIRGLAQRQQAQIKAWVQNQARWVQDQARIVPPAPAPSPPKISATETKRPKMGVVTALSQAILQAWPVHVSVPAAVVAEKPEKTSPTDVPAKPGPPSWVNSPPTMDDHCYRMSVHSGPYTTPLECERELHRLLQAAVAEYADLSLGPESAGVRLPDDDLQQLVHDRWTEVRPMEIGGSNQDMFTLHALVVFDAPAQERIKAAVQRMKDEAQRLVIDQRLQGGAVVFGGVLGLLALTWGGLKWATARQKPEGQKGHQGQQGEPGEQKRAARSFPTSFLAVIAILPVLAVRMIAPLLRWTSLLAVIAILAVLSVLGVLYVL